MPEKEPRRVMVVIRAIPEKYAEQPRCMHVERSSAPRCLEECQASAQVCHRDAEGGNECARVAARRTAPRTVVMLKVARRAVEVAALIKRHQRYAARVWEPLRRMFGVVVTVREEAMSAQAAQMEAGSPAALRASKRDETSVNCVAKPRQRNHRTNMRVVPRQGVIKPRHNRRHRPANRSATRAEETRNRAESGPTVW